MAIKKKEYENLSDSNIKRVIELLEREKPVTKKVACEILNISYNTTRLTNIIEGYKTRKATEKRQKAANRGKPASDYEISEVAKNYLQGEAIIDIAKSLYRSPSFVKAIIDKVGIPKKLSKEKRRLPAILPDECISDSFSTGQIAWSAVYHSACEIIKEVESTKKVDYESKYAAKVYQVYIIKPIIEEVPGLADDAVGGFYAYSPAYDLGSLNHLLAYGINFNV
jgi:hypothetical protein